MLFRSSVENPEAAVGQKSRRQTGHGKSRPGVWLASAHLALALALCSQAAIGQKLPSVIVDTPDGEIAGQSSGQINVFRGIPFALPPIGGLRWKPPVPQPARPGVSSAVRFGPSCMQPAQGSPQTLTDGFPQRFSEDCLTLNIWAPKGHNLPVMVWVHGGAFFLGSGSEPLFDGTNFARDGVILVTINYRLGPFGFFAHKSLMKEAGPYAPLANYGIMDQREALRWVQRNIAAFGGDPNNVTLFGQSAGAVSVLALLTLPDEHLFARAIHQSGGPWVNNTPLSISETQGRQLAEFAGAAPDASAEQLRSLPAEALLSAAGKQRRVLPYPFRNGEITTQPIIDGRFIRDRLDTLVETGHLQRVPLIVGFNSGEDSLIPGENDPSDFLSYFKAASPQALSNLYRADRADAYGARVSSPDVGRSLFQDAILGAPARWLARQASKAAPSYLYFYDAVPQGSSKLIGAPHGDELPMLFGNLLRPDRGALTSSFSYRFRQCWVSFAKSGSPNCGFDTAWVRYSNEDDKLLNFTSSVSLISKFRKDRFDWLDSIHEKYRSEKSPSPLRRSCIARLLTMPPSTTKRMANRNLSPS